MKYRPPAYPLKSLTMRNPESSQLVKDPQNTGKMRVGCIDDWTLGYRLLSGSARKAQDSNTVRPHGEVKHSINHGKVIKKQASRF